ncbi:hypothetical protein TSH58p_15060 [Azospirillum sp. TSH58]|uniref:hypothetical protein n=1 Tax=Azospirillum sp. TSH58 TaxID=664962 RepID=UPI000D600FF8|nr:hypothetical protein [Azospirillum sp. TSH58]AWJ84728.1 hypothetical protein TSH58p_15060 [Azospirillum sp. TSH58]
MLLEQRGIPYVLAVRGNEVMNVLTAERKFLHLKASALAGLVTEDGWKRLSAGVAPRGSAIPTGPGCACSACRTRHLITAFQRQCPPGLALILSWSVWRRTHQAVARSYHWGRHFMTEQPQL